MTYQLILFHKYLYLNYLWKSLTIIHIINLYLPIIYFIISDNLFSLEFSNKCLPCTYMELCTYANKLRLNILVVQFAPLTF